MNLNIIYTIKEYMEQGLTESEAYAMKMHDKLVNKSMQNGLSKKEDAKLDALIKGLGV